MINVGVGVPASPYVVHIGPGILADQLATYFGGHAADGKDRSVSVVTDRTVRTLHGAMLDKIMASAGLRVDWFVTEPGEATKSWSVLQQLVEWLLAKGTGRHDHVIAFGGGVVGDLCGFACAITKRGCPVVQIPTTLLAQVDSSVGGKTAINVVAGKNLVGAFHQPAVVFADTALLATLSTRQMRAGYSEVLKYALLGDAVFFSWLENHGQAVLARKEPVLSEAVARCVAAKARIVVEDERETKGRRALLNLGHTFGHALEAANGFSDALLHGEAVAAGMVLAARFSGERGVLPRAAVQRIEEAVGAAGLPTGIAGFTDCDGARLVSFMRQDKKAEGGVLPFILLRSVGKAYVERGVDIAEVAAFLNRELQL